MRARRPDLSGLWAVLSPSSAISTAQPTTNVPRGANILRHIFHDHFHAFAEAYDSFYAQDYGKFRLERISHVVDKFESCGDYTKGIARIRGHGIPWHSALLLVCHDLLDDRSHDPLLEHDRAHLALPAP
jgi:hypothetical protein